MKKNDIFLASAVMNIVAGAGFIALGVIGAVSWARHEKRVVMPRRVRR